MNYIVFDLEWNQSASGKRFVNKKIPFEIIEIGAVKVENGEITDRFSSFVNPDTPIPLEIEKLTGIQDEMVMDSPMIDQVLPRFLDFAGMPYW